MADYTIEIPYPQLAPGQKFITRYRELPGGSYSSPVDRTNAQFTISGLNAGSVYELEVIFFNGSINCPATYRQFTVADIPSPPSLTCIDFTPTLEQNGLIYELVLSYSLPSPPNTPPCGYKIRIIQDGNTQNITLPSLSLSGEEKFTVPSNNGLQVIVWADYCNGNLIECLNEDVVGIEPACTPMIVTGTTIERDTSNPDYWVIKINFINSIPPTLSATIFFAQDPAQVKPGLTPNSGTRIIPMNPTAVSISFPVLPSIGQWTTPTYTGTILDECGQTHSWNT